MAKIHPFNAIHYNTKSVSPLSDVIIPPYDVITPDEKEAYLKKTPYNFAHIILPQSATEDYSRAANLLSHWKKDKILAEETKPFYYLYQQNFEANGKNHSRRTLMATVPLSDFSEGIVKPHENVHEKYRADRLQILRKTGHQLSHVFGMVKDSAAFLDTIYEKVMFQEPMIQATTDDKVTHILWRVDPKFNHDLERFFADKPIYIVDGHHRYSSNLMHAKEIGAYGNPSHPASQMLFAIANAYDPSLVVFPTHRLVRGKNQPNLFQDFNLTPLTWDKLIAFTTSKPVTPSFGLCYEGKTYLAEPKGWQEEVKKNGSLALLSVWWSDEKILKEKVGIQEQERSKVVTYVRTAEEMKSLVGSNDMAFLHPVPQTEIVMKIADENLFMPQKSTYFYPKLAAGVTFRNVK